MSWSELTDWWLAELEGDSAYEEVVSPLLIDVLRPEAHARYLDAGSGEGRLMRRVVATGARVVGLDVNEELVRQSAESMVARLPDIPFRADSFDGIYSALTLEHLPDVARFFEEAHRVVGPGGCLAIVVNHPIWTAPGSTPISDADGEVLWRPGEYFESGFSDEPAGSETVRFYHRSMSDLLNAAGRAGWSLEIVIERPHHDLVDQSGIPRLLACRWTK